MNNLLLLIFCYSLNGEACLWPSQNMWHCFCQFLPLPTPLWPCVTASSTPHHKICDSEPTPPPQKKILTKHKFNMQQQIQNVIYKSTLFQCLIKPQPKQFPTQVLVVRWINESAVFHGDARSILIENIDLSSKGHIFASTVLFCYRPQGINFSLYISICHVTLHVIALLPLVTLCDSWSNTPTPTSVAYFVNGP
jgi:hypothetical protein